MMFQGLLDYLVCAQVALPGSRVKGDCQFVRYAGAELNHDRYPVLRRYVSMADNSAGCGWRRSEGWHKFGFIVRWGDAGLFNWGTLEGHWALYRGVFACWGRVFACIRPAFACIVPEKFTFSV